MAVFYKRNLQLTCLFLTISSVALSRASFGAARGVNFDKARVQFNTGLYSQCIETTKKATANRAYDPRWSILMVESLMELGRYEDAAKEIDTALLRHPASIRLLQLGYTASLYSGRERDAYGMLSRISRTAGSRALAYWEAYDVVALGEVLLTLGAEPKVVMDQFYTRVLQADPNCRQAYVAAAELAMDKQDFDLAANQYRKALERFADDPAMHYGLARAFYQSDRNAMMKSLDAALFINPNHAPSLLLLAEHQIDCEDYAGASKTLDRAAAVNPSKPEVWAYRCVLAHMANDQKEIEQTRANAFKSWSTNPKVDYLIGLKLSQKYRFAEAEKYQRQSLNFDPDYQPAKIQLAQDLLRLGHEKEGWTLAERVHNKDAYNVQAYNLLNLRDHIAKFTTLQGGRFIVRMDEREAAVYGQEVLELLIQAEFELCDKYGIKLDQPVILEIFPDQQDFAVRTFGIPGGDGFLGVCFGNVITANSPRAERPTNWKATLWHEFCHVVTLNMTHNKMPRWLSEGISVYEEKKRNPTWGQHMNPQYRSMILDGKLTPIGNLSAAFLSPESQMHLMFAYYESSLVVEFLVEKYGYDCLKAILADLANGAEINQAITKHAEPLEKIEPKFAVFAQKKAENLAPKAEWDQPENGQFIAADAEALAEWLKEHPNNIWALAIYAGKLISEGNFEQAQEPLKKLIDLNPNDVGQSNSYLLLAEVYRNLGQTEQERLTLEKLAEISPDSVAAYGRLMEIAAENENWQEVVKNGEKYMAVYPMPTTLHWQLGDAYEKLGRREKSIRAYRRLLSLDYTNPAELNYRLGRLLEQKDPAAAKKHVLTALSEAPRFRQAHKLLLKIIEENSPEQNEPAPDKQVESSTTQENTL
ncbi:MAG: tetratricopeptide repeat protein [Sedimentisphaerales bacterium]|nr:tetratricopeptide repeat protein [Sedimentisphaerales bacterium]